MMKTAAISIALVIAFVPVGASARNVGLGRHATFLDLFPREQQTCGRSEWTFPGLLLGQRPVVPCILNYRGNKGSSPFGEL